MSRLRGLSTVASFVVFLTAFAVVMFSVFFFYDLLRGEAQRGVAAVQSSVVRDVSTKFVYADGVCGVEGGPYIYYLQLREEAAGGSVVYGGAAPPCPPGPGMYKYLGVERSGDVGYAYVYVGPLVVDVVADRRRFYVNGIGDEFSFSLYLKIYNNSSGWAPASFTVELIPDAALSCSPTSWSRGPASISPAGLESALLGDVTCRVVSPIGSGAVVHAAVTQTYRSWTDGASVTYSFFVPIVVEVVNSTAPGPPPPPGGACVFTPAAGSRFGSPSGSSSDGFNELNGWVAAWGGDGGGVTVALMPGIRPPDSTGTGESYTVQLTDAWIGVLTVEETATVSVAGAKPPFVDFVGVKVDGVTIYDDGTPAPVALTPGTYNVYVDLRMASDSNIYGQEGQITLLCAGTPVAAITLRVPNPDDWGIRVDVYDGTSFPVDRNTYKGTWSVGAIYFWGGATNPIQLTGPYFTIAQANRAPKWAAYWLNRFASAWTFWSLKYRGTLYVPWSDIRIGVWIDDRVQVAICNIDVDWAGPSWRTATGTCTPGPVAVTMQYIQRNLAWYLIFVVGPQESDEGFIPTIDGAYYCDSFNWEEGGCNSSWTFRPASSGGVPYFVAGRYTPGDCDGCGTPEP